MAQKTKVNRRDFLKMLGAFGSYSILPLGAGNLFSSVRQALVNVPPSLMLHSADGNSDFLPQLLEYLNQNDFTLTTYQAWHRGLLQNSPVSNPVILSIDDISLAKSGCHSFKTFVQMKEWIKAVGGTAVYGVITQPVIGDKPVREQDESRWDMMQAWVEAGFELASHTTYHSNFNARDSGPRSDFTVADYDAEIVQSAQLIEGKLRERGIKYKVESLILPYGSGYAYKLPQPSIHAGIANACRKTNIKFVVGIPQGQGPIPLARFHNPDELIYVGRVPPVYFTEPGGGHMPQAAQTAVQLALWHEKFAHIASPNVLQMPM